MAACDGKIVEEFTRLLDKSKQLFNGLRELPPHGHKHWQAYFGRTFDVYTKLWKFQQQYRQVLDAKLCLKRWQIGEIASKIGQLYYHYYLRTSETNYLFESFAFYAAIRQRQYYADIETEHRADLVVKKLRYYARFIVVCLLLNRTKLLDELLTEFAAEIDKFAKSYGPDEQLEWSLVIDELRAFLRADRCVEVVDSTGHLVPLVHRLTPFSSSAPAPPMSLTTSSLPSMKTSSSFTLKQQQQQQNPFGTFTFPGIRQHLRLQEAVIVGASHAQPRFSELTIDAYRLAQAIERQPDDILVAASATSRIYDSSPVPVRRQGVPAGTNATGVSLLGSQAGLANVAAAGALSPSASLGMGGPTRRENPHKYLIYRPTFAQLFNCISAAHRDVSSNGVLLVYLSSDAAGGLPASPQMDQRCYSPGTWAINEGGQFGTGTSENIHRRQQKPHIVDLMNSTIQLSQNVEDAGDFTFGVATEANENASRNCVLSDEHLAIDVQSNQQEDGYATLDGATAMTASVSGAESESRHRKRTKQKQQQQQQQQGNNKTEICVSPGPPQTSGKDRNCLYPGDLYPFLRKALMLIIDSENSSAFSHFPCLFGQPLVALLSPPRLPAPLAARRRESGGLFTLFLHSPLAAFCFVCGVRSMPVALWDRCQAIVHKFLLATCRLFLSPPTEDIDPSYVAMFSDDFLRSLVLRFVFCHYVLSCHVTTTIPKLTKQQHASDGYLDGNEETASPLMPVVVLSQYLPLACPQLPRKRILANTQLFSIVADLAGTLSILDQFPCLAAFGQSTTTANYAIVPSVNDACSPATNIYQNLNQPKQQLSQEFSQQQSFFASKQQKQHRKHHERASSAARPIRPASASQASPGRQSPPALPARNVVKSFSKSKHRDGAAGTAN